jgi:hypothetical protein
MNTKKTFTLKAFIAAPAILVMVLFLVTGCSGESAPKKQPEQEHGHSHD